TARARSQGAVARDREYAAQGEGRVGGVVAHRRAERLAQEEVVGAQASQAPLSPSPVSSLALSARGSLQGVRESGSRGRNSGLSLPMHGVRTRGAPVMVGSPPAPWLPFSC